MATADNNLQDMVHIATGDAPRVLAGLMAGRLVSFVMADESVRPMLVVIPNDATGPVNGVLFIDGPHDRALCPLNIMPEQSGAFPEVAVRMVDVAYSELHEPGTWHWPAKQPVIAAGIDAEAINMAVALMMEPVVARMRQQIIDDVSERLEALKKLLQDSLDSHSDLLNDTLAKVKHPVLPLALEGESGQSTETLGPCVHDPEGLKTVPCAECNAGTGAARGCSHAALRHDRTCISCGEAVPFNAVQEHQAEELNLAKGLNEAKSAPEGEQSKAASGQDGQSAS